MFKNIFKNSKNKEKNNNQQAKIKTRQHALKRQLYINRKF